MAAVPTYRIGDWVKVVGPCLADGRPRHFNRRIGRVAGVRPGGILLIHFKPVVRYADDWDLFRPEALRPHQPTARREATWLIDELSK